MNDSKPSPLNDLIAAERASTAEPGADDRIWAEIERRLIDGPPPPELGASTASPILKWVAGLALVGGVLASGALLGGGDRGAPGGASAGSSAVDASAAVEAPPPGEPATAEEAPEEAPEPADAPEASADAGAAAEGPGSASGGAATESLLGQVEEDRSRGTGPEGQSSKRPRRRPAAATSAAADPPGPTPADPPGPAADPPLDLDAELRLIARIRGALRRGDPEAALTLIGEHRRLFADGALIQERAAHEVEALCQLGRADAAAARVKDFLARWPESPHRARVEKGCAGS